MIRGKMEDWRMWSKVIGVNRVKEGSKERKKKCNTKEAVRKYDREEIGKD